MSKANLEAFERVLARWEDFRERDRALDAVGLAE